MEAVNGQCVAVRLQMKLLNPSVAKHTLADYYEKENTNNIKKKSSNNSAMSLVTHLPSAAKPEKQSGEKKTSTKLPENAAYPVTSRPLFTILTWQPTPTRKGRFSAVEKKRATTPTITRLLTFRFAVCLAQNGRPMRQWTGFWLLNLCNITRS